MPAGLRACGLIHDFAACRRPYCYLLGLYLGDGCISRIRRVWRLRDRAGHEVPGDHRTMPRGNRHADAQSVRKCHATAAATARLDEFVGPKDRAVPLNGVHYTA